MGRIDGGKSFSPPIAGKEHFLFSLLRDEMTDQLQIILHFCQSKGRVCPQPMKWKELWEMLPGKERKGLGWEPSLPLILAAWWEASPEQKRERFHQHLVYAEEKGALDKIEVLLRGLSENEWFHEDD